MYMDFTDIATFSPAVGGARVVTTSIICLFVLATLSPAVGGATVVTKRIFLLLVLLTLSSSKRGVRRPSKASDDRCC